MFAPQIITYTNPGPTCRKALSDDLALSMFAMRSWMAPTCCFRLVSWDSSRCRSPCRQHTYQHVRYIMSGSEGCFWKTVWVTHAACKMCAVFQCQLTTCRYATGPGQSLTNDWWLQQLLLCLHPCQKMACTGLAFGLHVWLETKHTQAHAL